MFFVFRFRWPQRLKARFTDRTNVGIMVLCCALMLLPSCTSTQKRPERSGGWQAERLQVAEAARAGKCEVAQQAMAKFERRASSGLDTPPAEALGNARLETAYACLRDGVLDAAEAQLSAFGKASSNHPGAAYAAYLRARIAAARWALLDVDQNADPHEVLVQARQAVLAFGELVRNFPQSEFVAQARPDLEQLREGMARSELRLARQDLIKGRVDRGQSRLAYLVAEYAGTDAAQQADALLIQRR